MQRLVVAIGCIVAIPTAWAEVRATDPTGCVDAPALELRLQESLSRAGKPELQVSIRGAEAPEAKTALTLSVATGAGAAVLERSYQLTKADCASVTELLAAVLDRFLVELPTESWAVPERPQPAPRPVPVAPASRPRSLALAPFVAINSEWRPTGGDADVGARLELGGMSAALLARAALPHTLGTGHFQVAAALAGLGWSHDVSGWRPGLELRAGPQRITGYGFDSNHASWLLWVEGVGSIQRRWHDMWFGLQVAASPLHQHAVTVDRQSTQELSMLRIGVTWSITTWKKP